MPEKKEIILFSTIVIVLNALISFISYKTGNSSYSLLSVFTPSILALILTAGTRGKKGLYELFVKQTIKKTKFKWFIISLTGIPLLGCLAVLLTLNFDISKFSLRTSQLMPQIIVIVLIAVGEEYGRRGFLFPRLLNRFTLLISSIILGLIWGSWHFPAYLIGTGVPLQMNFLVFLYWVILGSIYIGWIYNCTRNVLTSILAHISANAVFNYLLILPEFTGNMNTFWLFLLCLSIVLMVVFYVRRIDLFKDYNSLSEK